MSSAISSGCSPATAIVAEQLADPGYDTAAEHLVDLLYAALR
ncbi:hypothetical protein [Micromonospora rosaria]|nr:hypothetical protein [Micromonospora rosaria]